MKTYEPNLVFGNKKVKLKSIKTNFLLNSFIKKEFAIKNVSISTKKNNLKDIVSLARVYQNSPELFIFNKMVKNGTLGTDSNLNFNDKGKINKDYSIKGTINDANFILDCTPFSGLNTIDYIPLLTKALDKKLPFVCANPDYESVEKNSKGINICMGTIAQLYKSLGGEIFILGKPKIDIYIESTKKIKKLDKSKVLAVGDSMYHDIQGANLFGVDSLLITSGIHQSSFDGKKPRWETNINQVKNLGI